MKLFTATWCEPCKNLKSWIKESGISTDNIEFIDIDDPNSQDKVVEAGVRGIPALLDDEDKLHVHNESIRPFLKGEVNEA